MPDAIAASPHGDERRSFPELCRSMTDEHLWKATWGRPGLDVRARATAAIAVLALRGQPGRQQLVGVIREAVTGQAMTIDEVLELILHLTGYAGYPAARHAYLAAVEAMNSIPRANHERRPQG